MRCVSGERGDLFCRHLVGAADVVHLLVLIEGLVQAENVQVFCQRVRQFYSARPETGEDIFTYITRISGYVKDIERLNEVIDSDTAKVKIPDFLVVCKIFEAVQSHTEFDFFFQSYLVQKPKKWLSLTPNQLVSELNEVKTNVKDLSKARQGKVNVAAVGPDRGRRVRCAPGGCFSFFHSGRCSSMDRGFQCRYDHGQSKRGPTPPEIEEDF